MAREDVNIRVSANIAEAIRMWKAMEAGPKGMANEMEAMGKRGKSAASGLGSELGNIVGRWVSIGAAISGAITLIRSLVTAQQELRESTKDASAGIDSQLRLVYSLMDYSRSGGELRKVILGTAQERGVTPDKAFQAAGALSGAGYAPEEVLEGGGLDAVLRILAANAAGGKNVDTQALVDSLTAFLEATGQERSTENLLQAGVAMQNLWAQTKLSIEDLQAMAPRAAAVSSATGMGNEMLAVMSQFRDVTDASTGATAFRGGVLKLQGAANNKKREMLLAELGLTPEDVDFQGESFFDVQKLLTERFKQAGPDASTIASGIFGEESMLFYSTLLNDKAVAETQKRLGMQGDVAGFDRSAAVMEGSLESRAAAAESSKVAAYYDQQFVDPETVKKNLMAELQGSGVGAVRQKLESTIYDVRTGMLGYTPEEAVEYSLGRKRADGTYMPGTRERVDRVMGSSRPSDDLQARPAAPQQVEVKVQLLDQNNMSMPHRADVQNVGKNKGGR
jgi:hypothetical protein